MSSNAKNLAELLNTDSTVAVGDIADGSVSTAKLADDAVTSAKLGASAVDATALASSAVTTAKIANNAVATAKVADGAVTQAKTTGVGKGKNLCINGGMQVAQRGTSQSSISSGSTYRTVDRFMTRIGTAGTWTQTQETLAVTDPPFLQHGHTKALKMDCTTANSSLSAGSFIIFNYRIEGQDMQHFRTGTSDPVPMTVSFWVKATKTGTNTLTTYQDEGGKQVSLAYTINASNTWEHKTLTIPGNTHDAIANDNTRGRQISWNLALGSNRTSGSLQSTWQNYATGDEGPGQVNHADSTSNNFHITGIQIELGSSFTEFDHEPIETTLRKCQRYYVRTGGANYANIFGLGGIANTTGSWFGLGSVPVPMRTGFTLIQSGGTPRIQNGQAGYNASSVSMSLQAANMTGLSAGCNASGLTLYRWHNMDAGASAALFELDAEL